MSNLYVDTIISRLSWIVILLASLVLLLLFWTLVFIYILLKNGGF